MNTITLQQTERTLIHAIRRWNRHLHVTRSVVWGPRSVIAGLLIGVALALISRLRPWLLPAEIAQITGALIVGLLIAGLGWIWLRPRPVLRAARWFDRRFALKERTSTALELTAGTIPAPPALVERQLSDALRSAESVNLAARLPIRFRWLELGVMAALAVLLAVLLLTHNPHTTRLLAERELDRAIAEQIASLERQIEEIDRNTSLTEEEKAALRQPLEEALEILRQQDISQQEAVAAMAEAQQAMRDLSEGMLGEEREAYQQAAGALAGANATSELARALRRPDLAAAAEAAEQAAREMGRELSLVERQDLAERLEQAAEALQETNPALSEQLRDAAEALRQGDMEAAQEAMQQAAQAARDQQQQLQQSPLAQQALAAAQQMRAGQQQVAQAGQQASQQQQASAGQQPGMGSQQFQSGQQQQPDSGSQPASGDSDQTSDLGVQSGEPGQSLRSGEGQPSDQGGEGETESSRTGQQGDGEALGDEAAMSGELSAQLGGEQMAPGDSTQSLQGQEGEQRAALAAGEGEGGAGTDTTQGPTAPPGEISVSNSPGEGDSALRRFEAVYAPSWIGGESNIALDVGGQITGEESIPGQQGEFTQNPAGQSTLLYQNVFGNYQDFVGQALESGRIPLIQRDIIHDYFSSLEP